MTNSPILESAIESLVHGVEHYFLKYGKSNKFPLLHIDQAIELLLKAKIQNTKGLNIYTKSGRTIDYFECFNRLKDIDIPERSFLEEIHDKRNSSQHIGASFDDYATGYYVKFAYSFFKNFMKKEFDDEIDDYLSDDIKNYVKNIIIEPSKIYDSQMNYVTDLIEQGRYEQSVISSWNALEFLIKAYSDENIGKSMDEIIESIKGKVKIEANDIEKLKNVQQLKDSIFFSNTEIDLERANEIYSDTVDISNSKIVIVPVKTPEKISKRKISTDENAEPVRIIDDTTPVENVQELYFANLKLYNSDNKYISNSDSILRFYKNRHELRIEDIEGYEFLILSAIHYKIPCWFWAKELTEDKITELMEKNLKFWKYLPILYSLDFLLLLSNKKSSELLQELTADHRINISSKSSYFLQMKNNLIQIMDHCKMNKLKRLEHIRKLNSLSPLLKSFNERITNKKSNEFSTVLKILKNNSSFEILNEYYNHGDDNTKYLIMDALSFIKDEESISFYMTNDIWNNYPYCRNIVRKLDAAVYCPKIN